MSMQQDASVDDEADIITGHKNKSDVFAVSIGSIIM